MTLPRTLAGRTAIVLLCALALVQGIGLTVHALDRVGVIRTAEEREVAVRAIGLYRAFIASNPNGQRALVREFDARPDGKASITAGPPGDDLPPPDPDEVARFREHMLLVPMPVWTRPQEDVWHGTVAGGQVSVGLQLPDSRWLNISLFTEPARPWLSFNFLIAFAIMSAAASLLSWWAVRRMVAPVATLAAAAERLGRDMNAPPLPEDGPREIAIAGRAFNTMAGRMRRLIADRSLMLAAISHDLRTPVTRLRLRAEFVEDAVQRGKMLADLDEMEAMIASALAAVRDVTADEPLGAVDLAALVQTVLDETADAQPEAAAALSYSGVPHLTVRVRPLALKRALTNLIGNAVKYGGSASVALSGPAGSMVTLTVDDNGPGIPPGEAERLFQPFQRLETSRNRETGGSGLGLTIARNILRAHGGEVTLANRETGGLRVLVTLPA